MKTEFLHATTWPVYRHQGKLYTFDLWRKDLELHLDHLRRMTLACPIVDAPPPSNATAIRDDVAGRLDLYGIPFGAKGLRRWLGAPWFLVRILWALRRAEVFHTILVEHPVLYGILFPVLRLVSDVKIATFVESSSWRRPGATGLKALYGKFNEWFARRAVRACHLSLHTQGEYLESLGGRPGASFVVPAVWINEADVVAPERLEELLASRSPSGSLKVGYFGWIVHDKGCDVLIRAVLKCLENGLDIRLDIYGDGPKREEYAAIAVGHEDRIRFCGMLPYGPIFLGRLSECDAACIPSRSNEHLRISVDSQSQGVPVVVSDVPGLTHLVRHGTNGLVVPKEDPAALAAALGSLLVDAELRRKLAFGARTKVAGMSHRKMHEDYAAHMRAVLGPVRQMETA